MIVADSVILICLLLSAFFSGMEIAFVSSNRIFLEIEKRQETSMERRKKAKNGCIYCATVGKANFHFFFKTLWTIPR